MNLRIMRYSDIAAFCLGGFVSLASIKYVLDQTLR